MSFPQRAYWHRMYRHLYWTMAVSYSWFTLLFHSPGRSYSLQWQIHENKWVSEMSKMLRGYGAQTKIDCFKSGPQHVVLTQRAFPCPPRNILHSNRDVRCWPQNDTSVDAFPPNSPLPRDFKIEIYIIVVVRSVLTFRRTTFFQRNMTTKSTMYGMMDEIGAWTREKRGNLTLSDRAADWQLDESWNKGYVTTIKDVRPRIATTSYFLDGY